MTCPPCTNNCNEGRTCPARSGNEIIEMARQAGFFVKDNEAYSPSVQEDHELTSFLEAFAKLVAAKEREACAEIVSSKKYLHIPRKNQLWLLLLEISDDIRARGQA